MSAPRHAITAVSACLSGVGLTGGVYLSVIGVAASRRPRPTAPAGRSSLTRRIRILVPAHNEENHLSETLEALAAMDYPDDRFEVHVVADNCSDRTATIGREHGVVVHERSEPDARGKGAALAWLIDRLPIGGVDDLFVVIDADTIVSPGMLTAFDRSFIGEPAAVQGLYRVKDAAYGGEVGFRAAALAVRHLVRPAGRTALGGVSSLYGNGMAFREPIARTYRWSNSLTEDLEMGMRLLLDGHMVGFAEDAVVEAEMPATLDSAMSQNERWEAGRLQVATEYLPQLFRAARETHHGHRWRYVDAAVDIALPPLTTLAASTLVAGAGFTACGRGKVRLLGVLASTTGLALQVFHVLQALQRSDAPPAVRRSLVRAPVHMIWKSGVWLRMGRARPASWVRTTRSTEDSAA